MTENKDSVSESASDLSQYNIQFSHSAPSSYEDGFADGYSRGWQECWDYFLTDTLAKIIDEIKKSEG